MKRDQSDLDKYVAKPKKSLYEPMEMTIAF
jgi:hypothetical protein